MEEQMSSWKQIPKNIIRTPRSCRYGIKIHSIYIFNSIIQPIYHYNKNRRVPCSMLSSSLIKIYSSTIHFCKIHAVMAVMVKATKKKHPTISHKKRIPKKITISMWLKSAIACTTMYYVPNRTYFSLVVFC